MAGDKLKRFLFPTEENSLSDMMKTSESEKSYFGNNPQVPRGPVVQSKDDFSDFTSPKSKYDFDNNKNQNYTTQFNDSSLSSAAVYTPSAYEEAEKISKEIMNGKVVIVNLEVLIRNDSKNHSATRIIDFLCGVAYALKADVKRINNSTFIFSPMIKNENMDNSLRRNI
ncbi:MAG: cell division protein SepF [Bacilli bacterium]|nr:cell division protein SepF [Bacilli bacterium]